MNEMIDQPGTIITPTEDGEFSVSTLAALNRAELDVQVTTAKRYPRSIATFRREALDLATVDQETAEAMFYRLPRNGKTIEGPSVRLAEIVAHSWGNLRVEARILGDDGKFITAQATAMDLEKNVGVRVEKRRRITNNQGKRFGDDMVGTTANAAASIAFRDAVFRVVPQAYIRPIMERAKEVAIGKAKPIEQRRAEMLAYFGKLGVQPERIFPALCVDGKNITGSEDLGEEELLTLRGMANAIKDGTTTIEAEFPPLEKPTRKTNRVADKLAAKAADVAPQDTAN